MRLPDFLLAVRRFTADRQGATTTEYGVVLAVAFALAAAVLHPFATSLGTVYVTTNAELASVRTPGSPHGNIATTAGSAAQGSVGVTVRTGLETEQPTE